MTKRYEYKTTHGCLFHAHRHESYCDDRCEEPDQEPADPISPSGSGWELLHTAASGGALYWTWRRVPLSPPGRRRK